LRPFAEVFGLQGSIISAVDLVRGVGQLLGWTRIEVPGATGYLDTDYAGKGRAAVAALETHDLVCVHVEAPDEASHEGRVDAKVRALEAIDGAIVAPLMEALGQGAGRILISPDHRTRLRTRAHAHGPVPFAMAGTGIVSQAQPAYDEEVAAASPLAFEKGHELMARFLA
jgi:2,3-bisphosphoglycerate-independent phosphoglycerate mutase